MSRLSLGFVALVITLLVRATPSEANMCRVIDVDFTFAEAGSSWEPGTTAGQHFPELAPQIVVWLEDTSGHYVDTLYITQKTGHYGIGNRPGREDFNSGPLWPYGRREETFPVWAHRHGVSFPRLEYQDYSPLPCQNDNDCAQSGSSFQFKCDLVNHECQDSQDSDLSHSKDNSSLEYHFCRPLMSTEQKWQTAIDAGTCASTAFTDKGVFSPNVTSNYPPRADLAQSAEDSADSVTYAMINPFDAVSAATPQPGVPAQVVWPIPANLAKGDYVLYAEVSKEADFNTTYNPASYPSPDLAFYGEYGLASRGQPSVVFQVPLSVGDTPVSAATLHYIGYGDPDGLDGNIRPPDATIDELGGTGAGRLQLVATGIDMYRLRVDMQPIDDSVAPGAPLDVRAQNIDTLRADVSFIEAGDDGIIGTVKGYEIRYLAGDTITDANFASAQPISTPVKPMSPGTLQEFPLEGLLPSTSYSVGVRAFDDCHNFGPIAVLDFTTADRKSGEVDACFIATAAYGSLLANEVTPLRKFRDRVLRNSALGELAIETYYTFGPAFAGTIGESELLRATARAALAPVIKYVERF